MRSDKHAPKNFDPADYRVIDYLDNKKPQYDIRFARTEAATEAYKAAVAAWQKKIFEHFPDWTTGGDDHKSIYQCNHCGHPAIRWVAVVEHIPTGKRLAFGEICANRCELPGRDAFKVKYLKTFAQKQDEMFEKMLKQLDFQTTNADVVEFLDGISTDYDSKDHPFLQDMKRALGQYGNLTENQLNATKKFMASAAKFEAAKAAKAAEMTDVPDLPEGRMDLVGEIVSTKWQNSDYGTTLKMLVRLPDGNKVYGTVPESMTTWSAETGTTYPDKGTQVSFTATVTRSKDDRNFGFFKRPSNGKVVA